MLEVIRDLLGREDSRLSVKEITNWFIDRFGEDYGQNVTPKWIGGVIRNHLHLKTQKSNSVYVIPVSEQPKLTWLLEKYGIEKDASDAEATKVKE